MMTFPLNPRTAHLHVFHSNCFSFLSAFINWALYRKLNYFNWTTSFNSSSIQSQLDEYLEQDSCLKFMNWSGFVEQFKVHSVVDFSHQFSDVRLSDGISHVWLSPWTLEKNVFSTYLHWCLGRIEVIAIGIAWSMACQSWMALDCLKIYLL